MAVMVGEVMTVPDGAITGTVEDIDGTAGTSVGLKVGIDSEMATGIRALEQPNDLGPGAGDHRRLQ